MRKVPNWITVALKAVGVLNILLATFLIFQPKPVAEWLFTSPAPDITWIQVTGIGLIIFGTGYLVASFNILKNGLALFLGLLGTLLMTTFLIIKFSSELFTEVGFILTICTMVIWSTILINMLYLISKEQQAPQTIAHSYNEPLSKTLSRFRTQKGKNLLQLSNQKPTLVIFLHQFSSAYCKDAVADLKRKKAAIEAEGSQIVFVHMAEESKAISFFNKYDLEDLHRISDPNCIMYGAFGLDSTEFSHVLAWRSWVRELASGATKRQASGKLLGESFRMPGIFLINKGEIIKSYRHNPGSAQPDYISLANWKAA